MIHTRWSVAMVVLCTAAACAADEDACFAECTFGSAPARDHTVTCPPAVPAATNTSACILCANPSSWPTCDTCNLGVAAPWDDWWGPQPEMNASCYNINALLGGAQSDPFWDGTGLQGTLLGGYWRVETGWVRCFGIALDAPGRTTVVTLVIFLGQAACMSCLRRQARRHPRGWIHGTPSAPPVGTVCQAQTRGAVVVQVASSSRTLREMVSRGRPVQRASLRSVDAACSTPSLSDATVTSHGVAGPVALARPPLRGQQQQQQLLLKLGLALAVGARTSASFLRVTTVAVRVVIAFHRLVLNAPTSAGCQPCVAGRHLSTDSASNSMCSIVDSTGLYTWSLQDAHAAPEGGTRWTWERIERYGSTQVISGLLVMLLCSGIWEQIAALIVTELLVLVDNTPTARANGRIRFKLRNHGEERASSCERRLSSAAFVAPAVVAGCLLPLLAPIVALAWALMYGFPLISVTVIILLSAVAFCGDGLGCRGGDVQAVLGVDGAQAATCVAVALATALTVQLYILGFVRCIVLGAASWLEVQTTDVWTPASWWPGRGLAALEPLWGDLAAATVEVVAAGSIIWCLSRLSARPPAAHR